MPFIQLINGGQRWRHTTPRRKAVRDTFDKRVTIGPRLGPWHMTCHDEGPREKVHGRWLSAIRASHIRWVSKAMKEPQQERREQQRKAIKALISARFSTGGDDLPF